jgi:hypothetical protein
MDYSKLHYTSESYNSANEQQLQPFFISACLSMDTKNHSCTSPAVLMCPYDSLYPQDNLSDHERFLLLPGTLLHSSCLVKIQK